ncbi:hypothetical protein A7982_12651 [Minicystis rosea]|nr:hypothetical protein A7982_12651 [Minicystis rosea]
MSSAGPSPALVWVVEDRQEKRKERPPPRVGPRFVTPLAAPAPRRAAAGA